MTVDPFWLGLTVGMIIGAVESNLLYFWIRKGGEKEVSRVDGLEELLNKAKYLRQIQCMNGYYQCKQVCARTDEECKKDLGLWLSQQDVESFFKDRTFFAKERSLRKLLKQLEKNENQHEESKDDYDLHDEMISYLNGRIAESRVIRIELKKLLEGSVVSCEGVSERSSVEA